MQKSFWQHIWDNLPWSLMPYSWCFKAIEVEDRWRVIMDDREKHYQSMTEAYRGDLRRERETYLQARKFDQRALAICHVFESLNVDLSGDISNVDVWADSSSQRCSVVELRFTGANNRHCEYHIVAVDVSDGEPDDA